VDLKKKILAKRGEVAEARKQLEIAIANRDAEDGTAGSRT